MKIKFNHKISSSLVIAILLLGTNYCSAENSIRQAKINQSMAESKINQLVKKLQREYALDGVDSVAAQRTRYEIFEQEEKLAEAKEQLQIAEAENR